MSDSKSSKTRAIAHTGLGLADRLGLRPKEVATALGLSERAVRQMLPTLPHIRFGSAVVVPIDSLRAWLRKQAQMEQNAVGKAVSEILDDIQSSGK